MKKTKYKVIIGICVMILVLSAGILYLKWRRESNQERRFRELSSMKIETESEELMEEKESIPENHYNWEALKKENEHIYAWVMVPNTNVDYPVFQHPTDDTYYLNHNMDGSTGYPGCIYSEATYNKTDLSDYHTVLYGHNMKNGTMFQTLRNFQDKDFFDENRYFYVFTPSGTYVYEIFAAYTGTNKHLMTNYYNEAYLEYAISTAERTGLSREDVLVDDERRILTLSTCVGNTGEKRYLVSGILIAVNDMEQNSVLKGEKE